VQSEAFSDTCITQISDFCYVVQLQVGYKRGARFVAGLFTKCVEKIRILGSSL
jgi:hypothetical protein